MSLFIRIILSLYVSNLLIAGFVPVTAIFYAVFHPTEGTKVLHQIPSGSIVTPQKPDSSTLSSTLFDFDSIKNYVIPKPQSRNRLMTFKSGLFRVVGYPVNIYGSQYARNSFSFNFCFVFPYDSDTIPYEDHVRRIGKMFRTLEEQSNLLSQKIEQDDSSIFFQKIESNKKQDILGEANGYLQEVTDVEGLVKDLDILNEITPGVKKSTIGLTSIESLIQQIFQDLNNYSECQIPIDSANSVDIKLFPIFPPPPDINSYDVPRQTVKLESLVDLNWDPTMVKILPFINGINSVAKISKLLNLDFVLTKQCIQHLMHYKCIVMLDIFQFSNMYSTTSSVNLFLEDPHLAAECQQEVVFSYLFNGSLPILTKGSEDNISISSDKRPMIPTSKDRIVIPSKAKLFHLYRSLHHGQTLKDWSIENSESLKFIDIRRFISFGVLRNLIYRIHSFPVSDTITSDSNNPTQSFSQQQKLNVELQYDNSILGESDDKFESKEDIEMDKKLKHDEAFVIKCLKKVKQFDYICTEMGRSKKEVETILNNLGDWNVINS